MQINRCLEIVYVLLRQNTVTAKALAERFGVSQRTIYRDIDTLSLAGIPVYTEKGKGGGISLLPDFVLHKSILSEPEQEEILSALQSLGHVKAADTESVLHKLSAVFNKTAVDWLEVDFSDWSYANGNVFNDFKSAILQQRVVEFDYYSTYGELTHRRVEPIQLWFKSKSWYVKGYCLTRQAVRLFKLTRVKQLTVTDEPHGMHDLLAPQQVEVVSHRRPDVTLTLKLAPEAAYRVYDEFSEDVVESLPDGGFTVTVTWPEDEWVYSTILSYGEQAEVLDPPHLRAIVREKLLKAAALYE